MQMPNEESKISQFIKQTMTEARRQELQEKLGLTPYQWTWHMNNPTRWERDKVVILGYFLGRDLEDLVREYEVGADKISLSAV